MRVLDEVNFEAAEAAERIASCGDHCVMLVADYEEASHLACPFIRDGLRAGERVLSWLPVEVCDRLEGQLTGDELARLELVDATTIYKAPFNGAELIARVVEFARSGTSPVRIVGGPMGDPIEIAPLEEWRRYETLAHEACVAEGITALCVYEEGTTPDAVLAMARRTHTLIERDDALRRNPDFVWAGA
jgi:hypothetical protein